MILESPVSVPPRESVSRTVPVITQNHLLDALSLPDREALEPFLRPVTLEQGKVLFEPGEEITQLHFPNGGAVSLVMVLSSGALVEVAMVGREGVTDAASYAGPRRALSRAIVQLPGEALRIDAARLRELADARPGVRSVLERYAASLLGELEQTVACNAVHRLEQRLAKWLLRSSDRSDGHALPLTQEFLSEMLGAQRTTVTQVASVLQRAGAIEYRRGKITVLDRSTLERMSCECYEATAALRGSPTALLHA